MVDERVITYRQNEIAVELMELRKERDRIQELIYRREQEYEILQSARARDDEVVTTTVTVKSRSRVRQEFRDALEELFDGYGVPVNMARIIKDLENYGYVWSDYNTAYYQIRNHPRIRPAGERGYYQLV